VSVAGDDLAGDPGLHDPGPGGEGVAVADREVGRRVRYEGRLARRQPHGEGTAGGRGLDGGHRVDRLLRLEATTPGAAVDGTPQVVQRVQRPARVVGADRDPHPAGDQRPQRLHPQVTRDAGVGDLAGVVGQEPGLQGGDRPRGRDGLDVTRLEEHRVLDGGGPRRRAHLGEHPGRLPHREVAERVDAHPPADGEVRVQPSPEVGVGPLPFVEDHPPGRHLQPTARRLPQRRERATPRRRPDRSERHRRQRHRRDRHRAPFGAVEEGLDLPRRGAVVLVADPQRIEQSRRGHPCPRQPEGGALGGGLEVHGRGDRHARVVDPRDPDGEVPGRLLGVPSDGVVDRGQRPGGREQRPAEPALPDHTGRAPPTVTIEVGVGGPPHDRRQRGRGRDPLVEGEVREQDRTAPRRLVQVVDGGQEGFVPVVLVEAGEQQPGVAGPRRRRGLPHGPQGVVP
jgi:hypothetical protein